MSTQVIINLPVADLSKSMAFFKALGFSHNPQGTDDTRAAGPTVRSERTAVGLYHDWPTHRSDYSHSLAFKRTAGHATSSIQAVSARQPLNAALYAI